MVSPENTNWIYNYGLIDNVVVPGGKFPTPASGSSWPVQAPMNVSASNPSVEGDRLLADSEGHKETSSKKRVEGDRLLADSKGHKETSSKKRGRAEPYVGTSAKACREKLRRDKLNDKFVELASILEPEGPAKTDKSAILVDAVRMVTLLKGESHKLKDSNSDLQEKIKELKTEKNELRDEKQRLKAEKEKLEQQVISMNTQPSFMGPPPGIPAAYPAAMAAAQGPGVGHKLVPVISYPGMALWPFMPPAAVDTSQDHELHPPVA